MNETEIFEFLYNEGFVYRGDVGESVPYTDSALEQLHNKLHPIDYNSDLTVNGIPFDKYLLQLSEDEPLYWIFTNVGGNQVQSFILKQAGIEPYPSIPQLLLKGYGYAQEVFTIKDNLGKLTDVTIKAKDAFKIDLDTIDMGQITGIPKNIAKARSAIRNIGKAYDKLTINIKNIANGISENIETLKGLLNPEPTVFKDENLILEEGEAVEGENPQEEAVLDENPQVEENEDIKVEVHEEQYKPPPEKEFDAGAEDWDYEPTVSFGDGAFGENLGGGRFLSVEDLKPSALDFYYQYVSPNVSLSSGEIAALNRIDYDLYFLDEEELAYRVANHTLIQTQREFINIDSAVTKEQILAMQHRFELTDAQRDTLFKRLSELVKKSEAIKVDPANPGASEIEMTQLVEDTMETIIDEGVPEEVLTEVMLATESAELIESILNPALFLLNAIFFALLVYALYKRLRYTWKAGGVIIPLMPPIWLFDFSNLAHKIVELPQDVVLCFDGEALKNNPSAYFKKTLIKFITDKQGSFALKEGVEWRYLTTTSFFAYKRDPRQDEGFSFSSLSPSQWFVNHFEGWVQWRMEFKDGLTNGQVQQAEYNIVMAMGIIYGINFPMHLHAGYDLPTVQSSSRQYFDDHHKQYNQDSIWQGAKVFDWDVVTKKKNWHDGNPLAYEIRWNSGINVTLVTPVVAQFRRLLNLPLRTEDYWYLLPNLSETDPKKMPWRYDKNNDDYKLKPEYHRVAGGKSHSVKLVNVNGIKTPISTGATPNKYWVLNAEDSQLPSDVEEDSEEEAEVEINL